MLVLRLVLLFSVLALLFLGIGYLVTKDRRYLRIAWRLLQALLVLLVAAGLLYIFVRVLLA